MKRFRLSTLMLLVVIAAMGSALVIQTHKLSRREVEMEQLKASMDLRVKLELALSKMLEEQPTVKTKKGR